MAEFKVIESQEEFDKAIQKRLERERATVEKEQAEKYKDYLSPEDVSALKKTHEEAIGVINSKLEELNTAAASHTKEVEEITARATAAEATLLKNRIAHQNGIPLELSDRLIGETEEELKLDAEKMAGFLKPQTGVPLRTTEPTQYGADPESASKMAASQALAQMLPQLIPQGPN